MFIKTISHRWKGLPFSKEEDYFYSNLFKGSFFSIQVWSDSMDHTQERRNRGRSFT